MAADTKDAGVRERPGCVLGVALGLLVLGSVVAWIILPKTEPRDGAVLFQQWFGSSALPQQFEITDAGKLMGGEEALKLVRKDAGVERALAPPAPKSKSDTPPARIDWARVEQGAADQWPRDMLFAHYPKDSAKRELGRLFSEKTMVGRLDEIGNQGGRLVLELGTIPWSGQSAAYVVEREFEPGGTFRDIVRLNLSKADDALVLDARWSRSEPFSKTRLRSLLESLQRP